LDEEETASEDVRNALGILVALGGLAPDAEDLAAITRRLESAVAKIERPAKMVRCIEATIEGRTYHIPEAWLVGATMRMTVPEAIQRWHEQAQMEAACRVR
jgi:hypothetical protein